MLKHFSQSNQKRRNGNQMVPKKNWWIRSSWRRKMVMTSSMIKTTSIITTHHGDGSSAKLMSVLFELTCSSSPAPMRHLMHLSVMPSALSSTEVVCYVSKLVWRPAPNLSDHSEESSPHPMVAIFNLQVYVLISIVFRPRVLLLIWVKPQRLKAEWASIEKSGGKIFDAKLN